MSKKQQPARQQKQVKPNQKTESSSDLKKYFPFIITIIFFGLSFIGILNHEMWRDELQAWLVARDAHSLPGLLHNLKYEGNPMLWHFFLFIITIFTHNPFWMQVFHILISTAFVFLLNKYSPFSIFEKILLTFGYFSFFEFNLISRSYGLGFLLVIIFCILYKNRYKYYLPIAIVLFLLANTHVFGLIFSIAFSAILFLDYIQNIRQKKIQPVALSVLFICGIIIFSGWISSAAQIYPSADNSFPVNYPNAAHPDFTPRLQHAVSRILTTYFALPSFNQDHFWNSNVAELQIFDQSGQILFDSVKILFFVSLLIYLIFFFYFLRKPLMLLLYSLCTLILVYLYYYTYLTHNRHCSHLFVILVATFWISYYHKESKLNNNLLIKLSSIGKKVGKWLFILILIVSFVGGIGSYMRDLRSPFSASLELVDYLKDNHLDKEVIVGVPDWGVEAVSAYFDRQCYYPFRKENGSFSIFDKKRNENTDPMEVFKQLDSLYKSGTKKMILVYFFELQSYNAETKSSFSFKEGMITENLHLKFLKSIPAAIVEDERYAIYLIDGEKKEVK